MKSHKKADLSLSVNAIVVLILAIVMLGLILGFIKTMFGKTSNQFDEIISTEKDPEQATDYDPIKLSKGTIILKTNEYGALKISVYNANKDNFLINIVIDTDPSKSTCFAAVGATTSLDKLHSISQAQQQIPARTSKVVGIGFRASSAPIDTICSICAVNAVSASAILSGITYSGGVPICTDLHVIVKS